MRDAVVDCDARLRRVSGTHRITYHLVANKLDLDAEIKTIMMDLQKGSKYMKKSEIKEIVRSAVEPKNLCRMFFKYDANYFYYFPFQVSDKLFLGAEEDDFIIDGFSIRRFCDLTKVQLKNDKCVEIFKAEKILDGIAAPELDLTDWHSAFLSLEKLGKNIIVEKESLDSKEAEFAIGRIEKVLKNKIRFRHFDADGIWEAEPREIAFSQITSVTFGSRYVEVFSKYI